MNITKANSKLMVTKKICNTCYCISKLLDTNTYYVHMQGYSYIPCSRTFTKSYKQARIYLAQRLSVTLSELAAI